MNEQTRVCVRIDNDDLEILTALADIDKSNLAHEIRTAVKTYIASRENDKDKISQKIKEEKEKKESRAQKLLGRQ